MNPIITWNAACNAIFNACELPPGTYPRDVYNELKMYERAILECRFDTLMLINEHRDMPCRDIPVRWNRHEPGSTAWAIRRNTENRIAAIGR